MLMQFMWSENYVRGGVGTFLQTLTPTPPTLNEAPRAKGG